MNQPMRSVMVWLAMCALIGTAAAREPGGVVGFDDECVTFIEPAWREPSCGLYNHPEFSLRWSGSKTAFRATCEKPVTTKTEYWDFAPARCLAVAGFGYFLQINDGQYRCCGQSPFGTTCQDNLLCPTGYSKDQTANSVSTTCRRLSVKTETSGEYVPPPMVNAERTPPKPLAFCPGDFDDHYSVTVGLPPTVTSANPRWYAPVCPAGYMVLTRTVDGAPQVTCEARQTRRTEDWAYAQASCGRLGTIGYFLMHNDGRFRCCGNSPFGQTCQDALQCPAGYASVANAASPDQTCRRKVLRTTTDVLYRYPEIQME